MTLNSKEYWTRRELKRFATNEKSYNKVRHTVANIYDTNNKYVLAELRKIYQRGIADPTYLRQLETTDNLRDFLKEVKKRGLYKMLPDNYKFRADRLTTLNRNIWLKAKSGMVDEYVLTSEAYTKSVGAMYGSLAGDLNEASARAGGFGQIPFDRLEQIMAIRPDGMDFSSAIWNNNEKLLTELNTTLASGFQLGKSIDQMSNELAKRMNVAKYNADRIIQTEADYYANQAELACYEDYDVKRYQYLAVLDDRTSETCQHLEGKVFKVSEAKVGINYPPMHPNCVLGDTIVEAPFAKQLFRHDYSGDIIKITTADGRRLSVTPNHIMLTRDGWKRAKFLKQGDNIASQSRRVGVEASPADYTSKPTIEALFRACAETGGMMSRSMPATAIDFKGDAIPNNKIEVIDVKGDLLPKLAPELRQLLCDRKLNGRAELCVPIFSDGSLNEFLVRTALATDGVMSFSSILRALSGGSLLTEQDVLLSLTTAWNTRVSETSFNRAWGQTEFIGDTTHSIASEIAFDNIIDIEISKFSGHIYDLSTFSTLYLANGFITSNCRSTTIPVLAGEVKGYDDIRIARYEKGGSDRYVYSGEIKHGVNPVFNRDPISPQDTLAPDTTLGYTKSFKEDITPSVRRQYQEALAQDFSEYPQVQTTITGISGNGGTFGETTNTLGVYKNANKLNISVSAPNTYKAQGYTLAKNQRLVELSGLDSMRINFQKVKMSGTAYKARVLKSHEDGFFVAKTAKGIAHHEFGHALGHYLEARDKGFTARQLAGIKRAYGTNGRKITTQQVAENMKNVIDGYREARNSSTVQGDIVRTVLQTNTGGEKIYRDKGIQALSSYGTKNWHESFAEMFAYSRENPDTEIAKLLNTEIAKRLK